MATSFAVHTVLILLLFLPFISIPDPPPGQEGILVNLGIPDVGQGFENAPPAEQEESEPVKEEEVQPEPQVSEPEVVEEVSPPTEEIVTTEVDEIKLKQEEEAKKKRDAEAKKKRAEEAKRKAEEEVKRKKAEVERKKKEAEAKQRAEASERKNQIGGLFGTGDGKGNTGSPGNQGDPNGDPNSDVLEGISTGSGKIGGGLQGRGLLSSPKIEDRSQKTGRVVVKVCVNSTGSVTEARYTQKGSTTNDGDLQRLAINAAKKFKFSKGTLDKQCGTITIDFKVK